MGPLPEPSPRAGGKQHSTLIWQIAVVLCVLYGLFGISVASGNRLENLVPRVFMNGTLVLLITTLMVGRDKQPLESLGLSKAPLFTTVGIGLLWVLGAFAVNAVIQVVYLFATGDLMGSARDKASWALQLTQIPAVWVVPLALFVGFYEEVIFRGFLLRRFNSVLEGRVIDSRKRAALAIALSGLLFGGLHGYQGVRGIIQTTLLGVLLGVLATWRRSTWPAIVTHFAIDAVSLAALKIARPALEEILKK